MKYVYESFTDIIYYIARLGGMKVVRFRRKHHIYTFVLGKGMTKTVACVLAASVLGFGASYAIEKCDGEKYNRFLKFVSSDLMSAERENLNLERVGADDILRHAWPVFAPSENAVSVFNPKGADKSTDKTEESKIETTPNKNKTNPYQKTIASQNLDIINATDYEIDAHLLSDTPRQYNTSGDKPSVLVMHTHGCETYTGKSAAGLGDGGTYRTTDTGKSIVRIGEILSDELNKKGIFTIHDKTLCDYPSYNLAYKTAMGLNDWYLNHYPSISFIFDIHRDAIAESDGAPVKLTTEIDGETYAQAMIVCGTDKLGLEHPYWKDNLILALKIQKVMEERYPTLMRPVNIREERFNMHQTRGSLIFEIGTHGNTMEEAERCIRLLAEGIGEVLAN